MSETDEHRGLVRGARDVVRILYPGTSPVVDLPRKPGDELPPTIDGHRPDLFLSRGGALVIGEAKTYRDLEARRTFGQVTTFVRRLQRHPSGLFLLSVSWSGADRARTLLRLVCADFPSLNAEVAVWDGLDLWALLSDDARSWQLVGTPAPGTSSAFQSSRVFAHDPSHLRRDAPVTRAMNR